MTWHYSHYVTAYIISAVFSGLFAAFAWRNRSAPGAKPFAFMMLAIMDWTLTNAGEVAAVETWAKILWMKMEYPGIAFSGVLMFIFSARFTRNDAWLTKKMTALLLAIPSITLLLIFTDEWHHLIHTGTTMTTVGGLDVLTYQRGPWYWVNTTYNYLALTTGTLLLVKTAVGHSKLYRRQVVPMLGSIVIAWGANALFILRVGPFPGIDLTPISFSVFGLVFYWSVLRGRLFRIVPMARDLLVEQMEDAIIVLDDAYRIIDVNPASRQFFNDDASLIGKDARETLTLWPLLSAYMTGESIVRGEIVVRENPLQTFMFTGSPLKNRYGDISGRLIVLRDITDRKRAEEALRYSEEKFRNFFRASPDPAYISTLDGRIVEFNDALVRQSGYSSEDIMGMKTEDFLADPTDLQAIVDKVITEGYVENYELELKEKDGTSVEVLAMIVARRDGGGNIIGFQGIIHDVSEKRKIELQLLQSEKLSSLGTMISGVAHELNNPLTSIIGNAQLLSRQDIPDAVKGKLNVILKESLRSSKIVAGLLAFAREHKPERSMVNINTIVWESMKLREYDLKVNNVDVRMSLSEDLPDISADPFHVQQVFINIISNARDALAGREMSALDIKTYRKDNSILIEFEDNGPGIPDKYIKKIFDPFFTTKEPGKGTGLGLSVAYGIIREHNGAISVESKPGTGTKFIVMLPMAETLEPMPTKTVGRVKPFHGNKRILVVDDEASVRDLLSEALSEGGFHVDTASNGREAIDIIVKQAYDVVIVDIKMPVADGREFFTYAQKYDPGVAEKVIFITGDILNTDTRSFVRTVKNRFIEKPFDIDVLLRMINDMLSGGS